MKSFSRFRLAIRRFSEPCSQSGTVSGHNCPLTLSGSHVHKPRFTMSPGALPEVSAIHGGTSPGIRENDSATLRALVLITVPILMSLRRIVSHWAIVPGSLYPLSSHTPSVCRQRRRSTFSTGSNACNGLKCDRRRAAAAGP